MPNIKLQSSDGEIFDVDIAIAKQSGTISTMLEDLAMDEEDDDPVPLPNVSTMILKKVRFVPPPISYEVCESAFFVITFSRLSVR